ncbi:hypothetical protein NPX13_g4144 [Xylaria arbuscula]|uniref:Uncharacterized protein n=1 Tax=Xylaria arbuscula TaxID=114810 RepID=A0A9W8TM72_9PEZI|nr:hypothetical protein NPX13_g4144 [Xylaria arbuscula]
MLSLSSASRRAWASHHLRTGSESLAGEFGASGYETSTTRTPAKAREEAKCAKNFHWSTAAGWTKPPPAKK